jgi:hypothetical protein
VSRVKLFETIRRERRDDVSIRGLADAHGLRRRTVRQAIDHAVPPRRKTRQRDAPLLGPFKDITVGSLTDDLEVPKKQRHTARRYGDASFLSMALRLVSPRFAGSLPW